MALTLTPQAYADDGFAGEDLGLDLYKKVDAGIGKMKYQTVSKRLKGSAAKLNSEGRLGTKFCRDEKGSGIPCFEDGSDFTAEEITDVEDGSVTPILRHLSKDVVNGTDSITAISEAVRTFAGEIKSESADQVQTYGRIGSIGLFTDGSVENSPYDLMKDLENIHAIIFAKDLQYGGTPNQGAQSIMNALQFGQYLGHATPWPKSGSDSGNDARDPAAANGTGTAVTSSGLENSSLCTSGSQVGGIDAALANDLASQLRFGTNDQTSGTPATISGTLASSGSGSPTPAKPGSSGNGSGPKYDSFGCSDFFCINVDFLMYNSFLLGGGKSYSIESVLDQNFKIVKDFAGSSFIQASFTNNFFQLLLKNLNLPSLAHLGVVVTTMPTPILNLNPASTPRGSTAVSSAQKEYEETTLGAFKDWGLDFRKQNDLQTKQVDQMVRNLEGQTTDAAGEGGKLTPGQLPRGSYFASKDATLRHDFADSFSTDLFEFRGFTLTFIEDLESLASLTGRFRDIPSKK